MSIVEALQIYVDKQVTAGDLLAAASPIVTVLLVAMFSRWRRRHPFSMHFAEQKAALPRSCEELRGRTVGRSRTLVQGTEQIVVEVQTDIATNASPFDLRFAERKWFGWRDVDPEKIAIVAAAVPEWKAQDAIDVELTSVGGVAVSTRLPKLWVAGQPLWIELSVRANTGWRGYLSFRANASGRRASCCRSVEVIGYEP